MQIFKLKTNAHKVLRDKKFIAKNPKYNGY